ncbi:MAG: SDR family oxidoreductase [Ferruginibacter sp.]|nr:SDR family oxidoreductase [Cytophagales bacterium]
MNIVIFGASGATGQELVSQALNSRHLVTAFVRTPSKLTLTHEHLKIVQGDVINYRQVEEVVKNQQAVISALGVSKPLKPDPAVVEGVQNIIQAMEKQRVKRLIYQSAFAVRENRSELGFFVNKVLGLILRNEIGDHEIKEALIKKSSLEYVIVRPSTLTNGPMTGKYRHGERILSSSLISPVSRADVADFMLRQLSDNAYVHKSPRVMK